MTATVTAFLGERRIASGERGEVTRLIEERYDQIMHFARYGDEFTLAGGVLDFYASDHKPLFPDLSKTEFTYQLSDHLPLWIQIGTDIDGFVLDQIIQRKKD